MNEFDQFMKHDLHIKHYVRYTDDFLSIGNEPTKLEALLKPIQGFLRKRLKLDLHPSKVEIRRYSKGIDFLGYVVFPHFQLLRKKTEQRMLRNIRFVITSYKQGLLTKERAEASLSSYLGVLSHANAHKLSEKLKNNFWIRMN